VSNALTQYIVRDQIAEISTPLGCLLCPTIGRVLALIMASTRIDLVRNDITDSEYQNLRFIVLRRFRDMPDAFLFSSILDSAGIECYLADENTIRMDWFWSNFLGRLKLCVRRADADAASSLLDQGVPEKST